MDFKRRDINIMQKLILIFLELRKKAISQSCPASFLTAVAVDTCPRNDLEWNGRAASFNCSSINQTCVEQKLFEYHCVLNKDGNGLVEVCAPSAHIYEHKCSEFNSNGNVIQDSFINCSDVSVPCPQAYRSSEAYKYQACYDFVYHSKRRTCMISQRSIDSENDRLYIGIAIGVGCFVLGTVLGTLMSCLIEKKRKSRKRKGNTEQTQEITKLSMIND